MAEPLPDAFAAAPELYELACRADGPAPATWEDVRNALGRVAERNGEWVGLPMIVDELPLQLEPRYPFRCLNGMSLHDGDVLSEAESAASDEATQNVNGSTDLPGIRNSWIDEERNRRVVVFEHRGRARVMTFPLYGATRAGLQINMIGASRAWSYEAELKAQQHLRALVGDYKFERYMLAGAFLETSPRSQVTYMFRRSRPTLALKTDRDCGDLRILAALCLHPVGFYKGSLAGCLTPADETVCHVLLMRGDEAKFWAKAQKHPLSSPYAGL